MAATRGQILADTGAVAKRPVIDTIETNLTALLNANSYQKGGWTLHMLRRLVGDSAFFRGVRQYYAEHRHGTAVTDDFRRAVEATSGQRHDRSAGSGADDGAAATTPGWAAVEDRSGP
jgi:aminopeptidase N